MTDRPTIYRSGERWLDRAGWDDHIPLTIEQRQQGYRSRPMLRFREALTARSQREADAWASEKGLDATVGTTEEYAHRCVARMTQQADATVGGGKLLPQAAQAKAMPKSREPQHMAQWEHDRRVNELKQQARRLEKDEGLPF